MGVPLTEPSELRAALEAAGWRCTRQRTAVYERLAGMADLHAHPTAEELFVAVRGDIPSISLATIYKALEALVESGLVTKLPTGDGSSRFDARRGEHYHLRCLKSGAVEDLPTRYDPDLVTKLDPNLVRDLASRGFRLTGYRLELVGYFDKAST